MGAALGRREGFDAILTGAGLSTGVTPLALAAVSSLFWAAALWAPLLGILGIFGFAVFTLLMLKYLMSVVEESADGGLSPTPITINLFQPFGDLRHLKLAVIAGGLYRPTVGWARSRLVEVVR